MWYEAVFQPDDNGTLLVTVPAFPEITTSGEGEDDAKARALGAIEETIAARIAEGEDVPQPGACNAAVKVRLPWLICLKVALYVACRERRITRAELVRRLGWNREQVERLFKLDHNSRLDQLEAAFRAIGLDAALTISEAEGRAAGL
jgi:antitoxin HicB